jgi:glutathione peroxidase
MLLRLSALVLRLATCTVSGKMLVFGLLFSISSYSYADSIYDLSVTTIDGKTIHLDNFKGKKILIVVLPLSPTDTILPVSDLKSVQTKYPSLVVIGFVSYEAGFKKTDKEKIKKMYKDMPPGFILTETIKAAKVAGKEQAPVLQWLTHRQRNKHFDEDIKKPGYKFFIDERGELYGALDPKIKISSPLIDRVIQRK